MKQTILSKCFSKMKRVALTLFAALCVGSVWAEEGETTTPSTPKLYIDPSYGRIITGLGELHNQVAVVFTNSAEGVTCTWTPPKNIRNIEFLAVGGGGGGGGHCENSTASKRQGGAGGGGGGVATGFIKNLSANDMVYVTVGAGGTNGVKKTSTTNGAGRGGNGGNTILTVGDLTYITAYGGGGDGGYNSSGVANGGSNSGVRGTNTAVELLDVEVIGEGAETFLSDVIYRRQKGGGAPKGYTTESGYPSAGGGGAAKLGDIPDSNDIGNGWASFGSKDGGFGGYGYASYITDERVVYGAGGGGGSSRGDKKGNGTANWATGHLVEGAGKSPANAAGESGLPNQGGGGGGGSYLQNGGDGGSGVVILRFTYSEVEVPIDASIEILPKISDKVYTGEALSSGLTNTEAYTVEELGDCVNLGSQTVRVTLNEGYVWADGDESEYKDFTWKIVREIIEWSVEPYITCTSWPQAFASTPGFKFIPPQTSKGELKATLSTNGGEPETFSGTLPTEPGSYTLRYWVDGTNAEKEWVVDFTIYPSVAFDEGYKVYGLGENGDEVAVVYTKSGTWTVPTNVENAQFLVVGGGGGGGADAQSSGEEISAGAGGGGGGVVTGYANFSKNDVVTVTVGKGGTGATPGGLYGAAPKDAQDSSFAFDSAVKVLAYAGGVSGGDSSDLETGGSSTAQAGLAGGSSSGSRAPRVKGDDVAGALQGLVEDNSEDEIIISHELYGEKGGAGAYAFQAGGGGGATEPGSAGTTDRGGNGGEGLLSDITGARVVYGSGGGGGGITKDGGVGGTGAGNGGYYDTATSAIANQGGGGGGGGRHGSGNGGNGGSGIVVFRYQTIIHTVTLPEIDNAAWYKGANPITEFIVEEGATISLTLKAADGYFFENGTGEMVFNVGQNGTDGETPQNLPAVATIGNVKYSLLSAALANATAGAEIELVAESLELSDNMTIGKNVTLNLGNNTLTIPAGKTVTVNQGVALTIKCGTGGLVVDGDIAVNGTLDISELSYGPTGLIANKAGSLKIGATGVVKLMNVWNTISPNWMMANNTSFFNETAEDAKLIQGVTTNTFTSGVWVKPTSVAITTINSNGQEFLEVFDTLADAFKNANNEVKLLANIEVAEVITVPEGVTLNLNGKSIKATAVVGKLAMNGGALETYDTNTQTYFFMAAPAQTVGALYWTSDAVLTIEQDYDLVLESGSVTLPNSWRTLVGQSLTIASEAEFIIPENVTLNLRGNAVVAEDAKLTCNGTIALGNTYDAIDTSATLTSVQLAEGKVTSAVEGYKAIYENGAYKLVEATVTVAPGGAAAVVDTEAAADAVEIAVEVPAGVDISLNAYKAYFAKSVTQNLEGKYEVTAVLKDEVKPVISTTKPAITFEDGKVTVNVDNELPGLYYGVRYATTVEAVETTAPVAGLTVTPAEGDTAGFFKVVVDFAPIPEAE